MRPNLVAGALFVVAVAGCGRPPVVSTLAPEGALACAVAHSEAAGFQVVEGSVSRGDVRLIRDIEPAPQMLRGEPPAADVGATLLNRPADSPSQEQVLLRYSRGQLEATAVAMSGSSANEAAGVSARQQVAMILNVCAADPSALPIGTETEADAAAERR